MSTRAFVVSSLLVVACVESPDVDTEPQLKGPGGGGGIDETQGREQMGSLPDGLIPPPMRWSSGATAVKNLVQTQFSLLPGDNTCLTATIGGQARQCADAAFNGYVFTGSGLSYTIVSSALVPSSTPAGGMRTGYRLQTASGVDYCGGGHLAHPVPAQVGANGLAYSTWSPPNPPVALSWACTQFLPNGTKDLALVGNGVFGKAIDWGFQVEQQLQSMTGTPADMIPGLELTAVATRMGRADYCHDGVSHTLEGTAIAYMDLVNGNDVPNATGLVEVSPTDAVAGNGDAIPVPTNQTFLEAVWTRPSAPAGSADAARPKCLSKLRWESLPLGTRCGTLKDPREPGSDGMFCEQWVTYEGLASAGGVIANASKRNDAGLWRWRHTTNGDHYTTTVGAYNGAQPSTPPATNYSVTNAPLYLGTLLTAPGKQVFEANYGPGQRGVMAEVLSCKKTGGTDWMTTAPSAYAFPAGYGACKSEGFLWTTKPAPSVAAAMGWDMVPLYVWKKGSEYLTTTATNVGGGYANVATLGWIAYPQAW